MGTNASYNTGANWIGPVPVGPGQSATFSSTGYGNIYTSYTGSAITPDAWTFDSVSRSYNIYGAPVNFGGTGITNNASTGTVMIQLPIGGTGGITQAGNGTLNLTGANTYTGNTTVSQGTLVLGDGEGVAASPPMSATLQRSLTTAP